MRTVRSIVAKAVAPAEEEAAEGFAEASAHFGEEGRWMVERRGWDGIRATGSVAVQQPVEMKGCSVLLRRGCEEMLTNRGRISG